jgi:hypothetical protein
MKLLFTFVLLIFSSVLVAQDEYEKKEAPVPAETIQKRKDSIDISEKKKEEDPEGDDASKAYSGMSDFKRNIRIGGGFNIGSYYYRSSVFDGQLFFVQLSPQLTYVMSEYFEGGLSTSYSYTGSFGVINAHSFSAGPILRAYPIPDVFLQVEGVGFYNTTSVDGFPSYNKANFNAFVGGGFVSRFSQTAYMITGVKINMMKNELTFNQIIPTAFTSVHFGLW